MIEAGTFIKLVFRDSRRGVGVIIEVNSTYQVRCLDDKGDVFTIGIDDLTEWEVIHDL